jgi:hypothetical protein
MALLTSAIMLALVLPVTSVAAQQKPAACSFDKCNDTCKKAGGRVHLCPQYCQKKIAENPKCR